MYYSIKFRNISIMLGDNKIKLFNIKGIKYETLQILNYHNNHVYKIKELKNKNLVSCSEDSSIIFYVKDNNEYKINIKLKQMDFALQNFKQRKMKYVFQNIMIVKSAF